MAHISIREHISRIKATLKLNNADARLTDRHIYALMKKHSSFLLKRDSSWLKVSSSIYQTMAKMDLIEVDTVEACNIDTDCNIKRSRYKLQNVIENQDGPIIRRVASLDGSTIVTPTESSAYFRKIKKATAKYDKSVYYWYMNGYLYFPNLEWDAVRIEAYFENKVENDCCEEKPYCSYKQDEMFILPDFLISGMDQLIVQDLSVYLKIPQDQLINKSENDKK